MLGPRQPQRTLTEALRDAKMAAIKTSRESFLTRYLQGAACIEEIDDAIEAWHEGGSKLELHEFLGLMKSEYAIYVENQWKFVRYLFHLRNTSGV